MTPTELSTALRAVHMRVTYFPEVTPIPGRLDVELTPPPGHLDLTGQASPRDVACAFRQIELLVHYAPLVRSGTRRPHAPSYSTTLAVAIAAAEYFARAKASSVDDEATEDPREEDPSGSKPVGAELDEWDDEPAEPDAPIGDPSALPQNLGTAAAAAAANLARTSASRPWSPAASGVSVVSIAMGSPLTAVLEIPMAAWPALGVGLLLLAERIATAPVRIARKRREELLKVVQLDERIELVRRGRADVLSELLRDAGPAGPDRGPTEVAFMDPDDPDDELEITSAGS